MLQNCGPRPATVGSGPDVLGHEQDQVGQRASLGRGGEAVEEVSAVCRLKETIT